MTNREEYTHTCLLCNEQFKTPYPHNTPICGSCWKEAPINIILNKMYNDVELIETKSIKTYFNEYIVKVYTYDNKESVAIEVYDSNNEHLLSEFIRGDFEESTLIDRTKRIINECEKCTHIAISNFINWDGDLTK